MPKPESFIYSFNTYLLSICHIHARVSQVAQWVVKNPPANAGDAGLIPWLRRFPGEGNGNPL